MILVAFAYIAAAIVLFGTLLWALEAFCPNATAGWFGALADNDYDDQAEYRAAHAQAGRDDANAASLAYWAETNPELMREAEQRWRAGAARRRGQDLPPVAGIGDASLDEIRREWDGGSPDVA